MWQMTFLIFLLGARIERGIELLRCKTDGQRESQDYHCHNRISCVQGFDPGKAAGNPLRGFRGKDKMVFYAECTDP